MSWKNILKYKGEETYNKDEYSGLAPEDTPDIETVYPRQIEVKTHGVVFSYKATKARIISEDEYYAEITYISEDGEDVVFDGLFIDTFGTGSDVENSKDETVGKLHSSHNSEDGYPKNLRWFDVKRLV